VTQSLRKLHNEKLHNLYSSPSIIRMVKSRGMRWAAHVARTVSEEFIQNFVGEARRKETSRKSKS
jgi:hypothetical protein